MKYAEHRKTYADIVDRAAALAMPEAATLLSTLPENLKSTLGKAFLSSVVENEEAENILLHLKKHSEITRIISARPSSALAFEYLYRMKEAQTAIDRYFLSSPAGLHVERRLLALKRHLRELIKPFLNGRRVLIDNIGSGPGHDMILVLKNHPEIAEKVHVRNVDPDETALDIGRQAVTACGLDDSFEFVGREFQRVQPRSADIVLLIGVLCPLPPPVCVKLLKILRRYVKPGGLIIYSTNQVVMLSRDPLTDFLMRLAGWGMDYKTDEESAALAVSAGLQYVTQFFDDREHFQCMTVARR